MKISDYISNIQQEINRKEYDDYLPALDEYKDYLEKTAETTPNVIDVVCQLAAVYMELRMSSDFSINVLKNAIDTRLEKLNDEEKIRLYTNLAFYYEDNCDWKLCKECLEKAVALTPAVPNAYDALGRVYSKDGNWAGALSLFRTAYELSCDLKYGYNYAISLYQNSLWQEAQDVFNKLLVNENNPMVLYGLGICSYILNDKDSAVEYAEKAIKVNENEEVGESQLADLFYLCDKYVRHNDMYDNCKWRYYSDVSWLGPYFYCLNSLGKTSELVQKYDAVINEKNKNIDDWQNETDPAYTFEDRQERIQSFKKEKLDIEAVYYKIVTEKFKPEVTINIDFIYGCYLIDCPRHQKIK